MLSGASPLRSYVALGVLSSPLHRSAPSRLILHFYHTTTPHRVEEGYQRRRCGVCVFLRYPLSQRLLECYSSRTQVAAAVMTMEAKKVEETRALVQQATTLLRDHLLQAPQLPLSRGEQQSLRTTFQLLLPSLAIVRSYETQHVYRCVYTTVEGAVAQVLNSAALSESDIRDVVRTAEEEGCQLVVPAPEAASQDSSMLATSGSPKEEAKEVAKAPEAPQPRWKDVYGCADAILALRQATTLPLRFPALFTGPRRPWRRLLLYGPPGTGKTQLAAATAAEYGAVFLSVSAADLLSKWVGESEKQVRQAFARAAAATPRCVLFFDEIDALCSARGGHGESEVARRLKTEFLLHLQTAAPSVLVLAATNMPWELDAAIARRFERFIHVGLPTRKDKLRFLCDEMRGVAHVVTRAELRGVVRRTEGFSLVDVRRLLSHAVMAPVAEWLGTKASHSMGDDADGCAAAQRGKRHGRRRCASNDAAAVSTWASPLPPPPSTSCSRQRASRKAAGRVMATVTEGVLGGIRSKSAEGEDTSPQRCPIPPHRENTLNRDSSTSSASVSTADTRSDADVVSSRSTSAEVSVCAADAPPVEARHFEAALRCVAATSSAADIARYAGWTSRVPE